jgi:hypothetical protein
MQGTVVARDAFQALGAGLDRTEFAIAQRSGHNAEMALVWHHHGNGSTAAGARKSLANDVVPDSWKR